MKIKHKKIEIGDIFTVSKSAECTVIKYVNAHNVYVKFNDKHGHTMRTSASSLRAGEVKNPFQPNVYGHGYVGDGENRIRISGKLSPAAVAWNNMLRRCYHKDYKNITYADCYVSDEWLNFQIFAEWFYSQNRYDDYQLDKDLLVRGNNIYSEKYCRLVPRELNTILSDSKRARGCLPLGVEKIGARFASRMQTCGERVYLGLFDTAEEAFYEYKKAKEKHIKKTVEKYKESICKDIYDSLINFEIKITD